MDYDYAAMNPLVEKDKHLEGNYLYLNHRIDIPYPQAPSEFFRSFV
jgi:hypothetical protein